MHLSSYFSYFKKIDWLLLLPVALLVILGLVTLYTTNLNIENPDWLSLQKQLIFFALGLILLFIISFFDYRRLANYSWPIYLVAIILLAAVLVWGNTIRGTTGWFSFWGFNFQPVELAKFSLVLVLSFFYSRRRGREKDTSTVLSLIIITAIPTLLTMLQPDLGSAAMLLGIGLSFFVFLSLQPRQIIFIILAVIAIAVLMWNFVLIDYQKQRIMTFIDPLRDPLGRGYNVRQSIIAVGAGGFMGRGLGLGTQSQLRFLPETSTDFIFATIAESLGFVGGALIIALFFWFFSRLLLIIKNSRDNISSYLTFGFGAAFFIQVIVNIGMNMGILPVTGLPLPFVSYGGSFLVISMIAIGIIENISMRQKIT
jgi:rod shape determining protein RodA